MPRGAVAGPGHPRSRPATPASLTAAAGLWQPSQGQRDHQSPALQERLHDEWPDAAAQQEHNNHPDSREQHDCLRDRVVLICESPVGGSRWTRSSRGRPSPPPWSPRRLTPPWSSPFRATVQTPPWTPSWTRWLSPLRFWRSSISPSSRPSSRPSRSRHHRLNLWLTGGVRSGPKRSRAVINHLVSCTGRCSSNPHRGRPPARKVRSAGWSLRPLRRAQQARRRPLRARDRPSDRYGRARRWHLRTDPLTLGSALVGAIRG
jgi:hypothetical protein